MTDGMQKSQKLSEDLRTRLEPIGHAVHRVIPFLGLFAIGAATFWSAGYAFYEMMTAKSHATIEDLLLLFILSRNRLDGGDLLQTNHMPLRFVVYVAITAVTRNLIGYVNHESKPDYGVLILAGAIHHSCARRARHPLCVRQVWHQRRHASNQSHRQRERSEAGVVDKPKGAYPIFHNRTLDR